jgi:outer membrane receptor protein involved in Fe transport
METYYQWLYNIPISPSTTSTFSLINQEDDFAIEKLVNKGLGQNYGVEFTLEKFWTDRFYMLATLSLYESRYKVNDVIWRSTRFNSNNASSFVVGKEWSLGGKKISTLAIDAKILQSGGIRVTPIDLAKSIALKRTVLLPGAIYEEKLPSFFRTDIQMEWKRQYKKSTGSAILGVQNVTNRKNPYSQTFDATLGRIRYRYLLGLIPVMGYKIDF